MLEYDTGRRRTSAETTPIKRANATSARHGYAYGYGGFNACADWSASIHPGPAEASNPGRRPSFSPRKAKAKQAVTAKSQLPASQPLGGLSQPTCWNLAPAGLLLAGRGICKRRSGTPWGNDGVWMRASRWLAFFSFVGGAACLRDCFINVMSSSASANCLCLGSLDCLSCRFLFISLSLMLRPEMLLLFPATTTEAGFRSVARRATTTATAAHTTPN